MRTTLTLDDDIADSLKQRTRLLGLPFKQVVNDALRQGLSPSAAKKSPAFRVTPLPGGFQPGVDPLRLNQLNDELAVQEFTGQVR